MRKQPDICHGAQLLYLISLGVRSSGLYSPCDCDITETVNDSTLSMYADDTKVFKSVSNPVDY